MLDGILADKALELAAARQIRPLGELKRLALRQPPPLDFAKALRGDKIKLIAEVKKASPSRGLICADFDPVALSRTYAENGAAAISVLTEVSHFQGSLDHLLTIRRALGEKAVPLLRKDFIFDPYQIYESRAYGADALLLIVAILKESELGNLLALSHELGMKCLVEVHQESEIEVALRSGAQIIGINNRDLKSFAVDLGTTERLRRLIPPDHIVVSESGIKGRSDVERLRKWGVNAILVGEALMSSPDIPAKMRELL